MRKVAWLCMVLMAGWTGLHAGEAAAETVLEQKFDEHYKIPADAKAFASIQTQADGKPALVIDYPEKIEKRQPIVIVWLKVDDVAGEKLKLSVQARAEDISKPAAHHHGGKFGLMMRDHTDKMHWPAAFIGGGSFDWKTISFTVDVPYGAKSVAVMLGLQETTGKICFRDLKVEAVE